MYHARLHGRIINAQTENINQVFSQFQCRIRFIGKANEPSSTPARIPNAIPRPALAVSIIHPVLPTKHV